MRKIIISALLLVLAMSMQAAGIENLKVHPLSPWGVVLSYTVSGTLPSNVSKYKLFAEISDESTGTKYLANNFSGDIAFSLGEHTVFWDAAKDGIKINSQSCAARAVYCCSDTVYCVIDLSAGASASRYPISYLTSAQYKWDEEDKKTKLVLKLIPAGSFKMQNSKTTTISMPFFIGVFEITQKQWELVMGSNPCASSSYGWGDPFSVYLVSYDMIRGSSNGAKWPSSSAVDSSSFIGRLRAKTGLDFDLPTEAQWEYACRAGTTTTYSYGDAADEDYMLYEKNASETFIVGTKLPNPWGLYDMHGNVYEWCLDWYDSSLSYGTDPKGPSSGSKRILRGGSWGSSASNAASSYRTAIVPSGEYNNVGFRLFMPLCNSILEDL